jgi:hypothetical protein
METSMNHLYSIVPTKANGGNGDASQKTVSGRSLAHRKLDARQKAAIVAQVLLGEKALHFSRRQLVEAIGGNHSYVDTALALSPGLREAVASGNSSISFICLKTLKPRLPKAASA